MPAPGSSTVDCPANATAPTPPVVNDNCGRALTVSAPVVSTIPGCSGPITYTFTYTACDNTTYTWVHTTTVLPPTVVMPAPGSSTVDCPANATAPTPPVVNDNCGRALTVSAPVVSTIPGCSGPITYTFTYTACDNTTYTWVHTTTVLPPTVVMPAPGSSTVDCPANATAPTPPVVNDNCGRALTVSAPVVSTIPGCSGPITYTFTYTACDNTTYTWVHTTTVLPPTVVMPAPGSSTVDCPANATAPTPPVVNDNCGRALTVSAPVVSTIPGCSGPITYIFNDTASNKIYYISVHDTMPLSPTVVMPAPGSSTVDCPA